jgi:hypothetical protein
LPGQRKYRGDQFALRKKCDRRPPMKVWADISAIFKIAFVCILVGFLMGYCASSALHAESPRPTGSVTEV